MGEEGEKEMGDKEEKKENLANMNFCKTTTRKFSEFLLKKVISFATEDKNLIHQ